jgi:hypothetical protein
MDIGELFRCLICLPPLRPIWRRIVHANAPRAAGG